MSTSNTNPSPPPRKKARKNRENHHENLPLPPCYLNRMPFELIAEILSHTSSPKDVLALARCSKFFCATLVLNSSAVFIWRDARARTKPEPVPDPHPQFTESSYAAFIFDRGDCDFCNSPSKDMYTSFALKIRLCRKKACQMALKTSLKIDIRRQFKWLPYAETRACWDLNVPPSFPHEVPTWDPMQTKLYRDTDLTNALEEHNKASRSQNSFDEFTAKKLLEEERLLGYMLMCYNLYCWKHKLYTARKEIKASNTARAREFAKKEGWNFWDLMNTTSYRDLYNLKISLLEVVSDHDFLAIRSQLEAELIEQKERRDNRSEEQAYQLRLKQLEAYYGKLKADPAKFEILPNSHEFRKLPFIRKLQSTKTSDLDLQNELMDALLKDDIDHWCTGAESAFAKKLGYSDWKTASSHKLHPAYRLSSLFSCTKCVRKSLRNQILTFKDACSHQCMVSDKKKRQKQAWDSNQFAPHEKPKKAVELYAVLYGIDLELVSSLAHPALNDGHILCLSCVSPIVMNFQAMRRHCERHEEMQITALTPSQVEEIVKQPIEYGLTDKLRRSGPGAKEERDEVIYACRHCQQTRPGFLVERKQREQHKLLSFNGLRSHLKEKHMVEHIGDEDYYRTEL